MRLVLEGSYERKDAEEARNLFQNSCALVNAMWGQTGKLLEPMAQAARMIKGHLERKLAHWIQGLTTAFMEGLNRLFSAVKRRTRGNRTVMCFMTILYSVAAKLTRPCY